MQILGIGTDIVECLRIGKMIEMHGELFLRRIYTEREIRYCQSRRRALEHFAAFWAAKEAVFEALGAKWSTSGRWTDLEVRQTDSGPRVLVRGAVRDIVQGRGVADILLSFAHCRTYATAYALILGQAAPSSAKPDLEIGGDSS